MNVLILADYTPVTSGGFIGSLHDLASYLQARGGRLVMAVPDKGKGKLPWEDLLAKADCPLIYLDPNLDDQGKIAAIDRIVETYGIDLMHIHFSLWIRLFTKYRSHWKNIPMLAHDHFFYEVDRPLWKQRIRQWAVAAVYRLRGIGVITVMEKKQRDYFLCGKKRWYIPNGISYTRNIPRSLTREESREMLGVKDDETLCLLMGWNPEVKGVDIALKAVEQRRRQGENVILGIVGMGTEPNEEYRQWMQTYAGISPEEPWIRYFPSTEDIYAYHRAADVYLSASRTEAFPFGILEALSQNVPVAASRIPGAAWAREYDKCVMFDKEDVDGCAQALSQAARLRHAPSNQHVLSEKYCIEAWCRRIMEIYEIMLNQR